MIDKLLLLNHRFNDYKILLKNKNCKYLFVYCEKSVKAILYSSCQSKEQQERVTCVLFLSIYGFYFIGNFTIDIQKFSIVVTTFTNSFPSIGLVI